MPTAQDITRELVKSLLQGKGIDHDCKNPQLLETHLSWVVLLGTWAYKVKKPLNLGFVDYSPLSRRRFFCQQELRLNRRTAPDMYLAVISIAGTPFMPILSETQQRPDIFEYAVKMRRFPQAHLLSQWLSRGELAVATIDDLARTISDFHQRLPPLFPDPFDLVSRIHGPVRDNCKQLTSSLESLHPESADILARVCAQGDVEFERHHGDFHRRHHNGHTRVCHGDLHLNNIIFDGNRCQLFDCIEFSERLSWIDTASDLAFTLMDLDNQDAEKFSWRLLNEYLAITGDYDLLIVLAYYCSYRAMVRAKVLSLQARQSAQGRESLLLRCIRYLNLAEGYSHRRAVGLVLMCGLSGSGKTTLARMLGPNCGFMHLRSDVERKRLFNLDMHASSETAGVDIYTPAAGEKTLASLLAITATCLAAGYGVIADATFIRRHWRTAFFALAEQHQLIPVIVHCQVNLDTASARLAKRQDDASEAGSSQLARQQAQWEPFNTTEQQHLVSVDTQNAADLTDAIQRVQALLAR